jgi:predicted RNase H-like HicB family nuclease
MKTELKANEALKRPYSWVLIPQEDGRFTAEILEFPGCITEGESAQEAATRLHAVAESWIEECIGSGRGLPPPLTN